MASKPRFDVAASKQVTIKLTPGQAEMLKRMAASSGLTVKDLILSKVGIL